MLIEVKKHPQQMTLEQDLADKINEALDRVHYRSNCVIVTTLDECDKIYNLLKSGLQIKHGKVKHIDKRKEVLVGNMRIQVCGVQQKDESWERFKGLHSDFIIMYGFEGFWEVMFRRLLSRNRNSETRELESKLYYIN